MQIGIIGFGYIGAVIGAVLSSKGNKVTAIDNNENLIKDLNKTICSVPEPFLQEMIKISVKKGLLFGSTSFDDLSSCDVILITVSTPLSNKFDADLSALENVFKNLSKYVKEEQIIMVKSTVTPGVTRKLALDYLGNRDDIYVGFSPERLAEGNAIKEFNSLPIVVGGINDVSTSKCADFWSKTMNVKVIKVSSCETAELVKLADNQWIDLNIALANELALLCDALPYKLDVLEIINGANSLKKGQHFVNYLTPSIGVGGYCLTKDPWFLSALGKKNGRTLKLPSTGRAVNDYMPYFCVEQILQHLLKKGSSPKSSKIAILGYSFKSNSGDTRFSPMKTFVNDLLKKGFGNISLFDTMINKNEIKNKKVQWCQEWVDCVSNADCVVFGASHDDIKSISTIKLGNFMKKNSFVFDGRRYLDKNEILILKNLGIDYLGVGRSFS